MTFIKTNEYEGSLLRRENLKCEITVMLELTMKAEKPTEAHPQQKSRQSQMETPKPINELDKLLSSFAKKP